MSIDLPADSNAPLVRVHDGFDTEFPDGSALATECFLNLGRVSVSVLAELNRLLERHGVPSYTSFNAMTVIAGAGEPIPPSLVAKRMVATRPTVTGILDTLERLGFVERRAHETDGRMRLVSLTIPGHETVRTVLPEVHRFEVQLFDVLDAGEQRSFLDALGAVARRLESITTASEADPEDDATGPSQRLRLSPGI